ncbi:MAG: DUF4185 domain-containing protein, partial [Thermoguttaceae bacterium]
GVDDAGSPRWRAAEDDAVPLFRHQVVGELSVAYCEPVGRYVMLYNSTRPRGIMMRSAADPWGPWSEGTVIFDPRRDEGYGHFIHLPGVAPAGDRALSDPNRDRQPGGEYGPYLMARFTTPTPDGCRFYYTMSTWNPYQVVVMQSQVRVPALQPSTEAPAHE